MNDSSGRVIDMNTIESTSTPFGFASRAAMASTAFVVAAFATLLGLLYANVLPDLVRDWWDDPNYSHGFLVPLFSAYLVYQRRASILATEFRPSWWGLAPILFGIASLVLGQVGAEAFVSRASLIVILAGLTWFHAGWPMLRAMMFPLAFLFFMVPLPAVLFYAVAFPLQGLAAQNAAWILDHIGVPVLIDGNVIHLSHISLGVTEACSGIRSLISLLASVAVARFRFRLRASFLVMLLIVQMIPAQALIVALFVDFNKLGLLENLGGLVIVYAAQALPVSIWMLRNFVATVPRELEEAAAIDGASAMKIFWRILFPLVAPGLVAVSIFSFITAYNEFIVALTFLGQAHSTYTLPIYVTYFFGRNGAAFGPIMAASTLSAVPVLVFFMIVRRRLVGGLVAGAVKG